MRLSTPVFLMFALVTAVAAPPVEAQAPNSIAGTASAYRVLEGSAPFAGSGYFILAPGNTSSTYSIFGITGAVSSAGSYSYSKTTSTTSLIRLFSDTALGNVNATISQVAANEGDAVFMDAAGGPGMQVSSFSFSNTQAPTVLSGRTFFCTIAEGLAPLAEDGTYRLDFTTATDYTVTGLSGQAFDTTGTYAYTRPVVCLGRADMNDAISGLGSFFYGFTGTTSGWVLMSNTLGGYQVAAFTTVNRPSSLSATKGTSTSSIKLTWVPQSGANSYNIYRRLSGSFLPPDLVANVTGSTYTDVDVMPGQQYVYTMCSVCRDGLSQQTAASTTSTGWRNIGAPASLAATDGTLTNSVQLTWPLVEFATGYNVYRSQPGTGFTLIGSSAANTYLDLTAAVGTPYTYKVMSVSVGESLTGVTDTGWRAPAAPTGLAATDGVSRTSVTVTWAGSSGANGYKIYRAKAGSTLALLATTRTRSTAYVDMTAVAGTVYTYAVRATTVAGDSALSNTDTGYRANGSGGGGVIPGGGGQTDLTSLAARSSGRDPMAANLTEPIDALDPARQWPCGDAPDGAGVAAIEAGSRDLDRNGEPDLCQHARGDLDLSGTADGSDVALLLGMFGQARPAFGDFDADGTVDGSDLRALLGMLPGAR